ncbi:cysteine--tRNA ligase [Amylibacter sp. IMCC11727]|uniref:cysteine--tRNA ligase n=1 Tax=Amylibacter sp. IMCC11727 TaxID=3039851 RepID=UPI00244E54F3|nr:cysteine--tRNA ligase [Amylibacter sp. IMCC11727]WGI20893.1 cysteine--tRNA ligase [Amylibacter sp. IMCC11727]
MTEIKLYNTKTRKKEVFTPLDKKDVRMYVCGPTVYDRAHIGNARPVIVFDVLYRLLREVYGEGHVQYARNFTDVDDKINATAAARKEAGAAGTLEELVQERTDETIAWYLEDMGALGNLEPDHAPRATEYIQEMVDMSAMLIERGHAYEAEGHVLFDVTSYENYGSLSGRSVDDMIAGARVEVAPYKRNPMDFVLWKPSDAEQPGWDSPWGRGRPGWHIECSAMAEKLFGKRFDIHGGGLDLAFPHHENEKAQSCACGSEEDFAQVWMHNEMLQVEGKKMSKSLGNFFSVRELIDQGYPGEVIRFVFLGTHYRKPMDWTEKKAKEAARTLSKWRDAIDAQGDGKPSAEFLEVLSDDLNTPGAISLLHDLAAKKDWATLKASALLLGLLSPNMGDWINRGGVVLDQWQKKLTEVRSLAMETKDFSEVDRLKALLSNAGVSVQMGKEGILLVAGPEVDLSKLNGVSE